VSTFRYLFGIALAVAPLAAQDPFADVKAAPAADTTAHASWLARFFKDNFAFREELMSEFTSDTGDSYGSRQSAGFEVQKKFSTGTSTVAGFDFQGRLVRRDGYNPVMNDMEGATRPGWAFEYHNLYVDLYNIANPLLGGARGRHAGRFNFRAGHFYVPFGLNLQTDTHGTMLQLSNETNFGFERDWYAGLWGSVNRHLNYDAYYMAGSGYDLKFRGQRGLAAVRLSLGNRYRSEYGLEGGVSAIAGERLAQPMNGDMEAVPTPLRTRRIGADARYRHSAPGGSLTFTTELSGGRDGRDAVTMDLQQAEYLRASRRWGVATQFRRFSRDNVGTTASAVAEFTWYFRNDVAGSNAHWLKLNVERQIQNFPGPPQTIVGLQYYWYR
jgi:hypothetical protein